MSGGLASIYAVRYPTSGVVNVDQPPFIAEFAKLVRRLEPGLRGAAFDQIWRDVFFASFHLELLPAPARELVIRNSHPDQAVVLSYWQMVLESPIEELDAMVRDMMTQLAAQGVPYLMVMGSALPTAVRDAMKDLGQQPTIVEWVDTGHFPHLAHPSEFARLCTQVGRPTSVSR
jgi:pimeloyl-ACP methyl ester carboxylesterase